ncbi:MAG: hypothetical protein K2J57_04035, partial [Bacteroidales bacterium]|nr:hypothetical protein [Bacteroidales bacterium]
YYSKIFHIMVNSIYEYGTEGYVYYRMGHELYDTVFLNDFCRYIKQVQDYCEDRNVSFLYCLNPSKISIYSEFLPKGYVYRNRFFPYFTDLLEDYGVHYIENFTILKEKHFSEPVFNHQYDGGHWNDLGAFYGTNHLLSELKKAHPKIDLLTLDDFEQDSILQPYMGGLDRIPIDEWVPDYILKYKNMDNTARDYSGIDLHPQHRGFANFITDKDSLPRVLFFHVSYYNPRTKFYQDRFYKTGVVHNYENFLNFDYYFNIFQPECVILETAEYTTNSGYFSHNLTKNKKLNKPYKKVCMQPHQEIAVRELKDLHVDSISKMLKLSFEIEDGVSFGYLLSKEKEYDLAVDSIGHRCTITLMACDYDEEKARIVLF